MERFAFYKEQYEKELARQVELNNSLGLHITILTIIASIFLYLNKQFDFSAVFNQPIASIATLFLIVNGILLCFISVSVFYLIKVYWFPNRWSMKYAIIPNTKEIDENFKMLLEFHTNEGTPELAVEDLKRDMTDVFCISAYDNRVANFSKSTSLNIARKFVVLSIVFLILLGFCSIFMNSTLSASNIQKVEIVTQNR